MKSLANSLVLLGATLALVGAVGCSDSTTKPKVTDPYANSRLLISGSDLAARLQETNQVIVDTRSAENYATGHVPGAISVPISFGGGTFDIGGDGIDKTDLKPPQEIANVLGSLGLAANTSIVLIGSDIDPLVGRMFWMLEYVGATDVRVLDGGFSKWSADGRATSTTPNTAPATTFTPTVRPAILTTKAQVLEEYNNPQYVIVDSRNTEHYMASSIPNAVNVLTGDYLNTDKTMKTSVEIAAMLQAKGVTHDKKIITHCYVGYRSSQGYFCFRLMGYDVSHYDGSWDEWNADPNTPKQTH